MSDSTSQLSTSPQPEFYTPSSGAELTGHAPHTIRKYVTPDAWLRASDDSKKHPLYLRETLQKWAAERKAAGLGPDDWRVTQALAQQEQRRAARFQGGAK
jgi:hypothetical protein